MSLTRFVKVGNISNLSDARYCAGMGVDMLGFRVIERQNGYMSPKQFQEIRGWISGPKVVAEIYGINDQKEINSILENYRPDFLELSLDELSFIKDTSHPVILCVSIKDLGNVENLLSGYQLSYILITDFKDGVVLPEDVPILIDMTSIDLEAITEKYAACGIALNGSHEISPGLKTYDQLADVLEQLDADE